MSPWPFGKQVHPIFMWFLSHSSTWISSTNRPAAPWSNTRSWRCSSTRRWPPDLPDATGSPSPDRIPSDQGKLGLRGIGWSPLQIYAVQVSDTYLDIISDISFWPGRGGKHTLMRYDEILSLSSSEARSWCPADSAHTRNYATVVEVRCKEGEKEDEEKYLAWNLKYTSPDRGQRWIWPWNTEGVHSCPVKLSKLINDWLKWW